MATKTILNAPKLNSSKSVKNFIDVLSGAPSKPIKTKHKIKKNKSAKADLTVR